MISIVEAHARLSQVHPTLSITTVDLGAALGRTVAYPITAPIDLPPFSRAAMDGYAVSSADTHPGPVALPVAGTVPAGRVSADLARDTAMRIFTGAPLPKGADAVLEQEATSIDPKTGRVVISQPVAAGRNIMPQAHQYRRAEEIYRSGERLTSSHLGVLAGLGLTRIPVFQRLRVAIIQTGDELQPAGRPLQGGSIYEVQARWLPLLIQEWGGTVTQVIRAPDDLDAICRAVEDAATGADLILTSGGISVGDYDFVGSALQTVADPLFWRVAMHPGRAVGAARLNGTLILALSGNPNAALTSWSVLAAPWWAAVQHGQLADRRTTKRLLAPFPKKTRETRLLRVRELAEGLDSTLPHSADVLSDPWNSGYALIPEGSPPLAAGTPLTYWQPSGLGGSVPWWSGTGGRVWTFDAPKEFGVRGP